MNRSFVRRVDHQSMFRGVGGGCAPCDAAAAAAASGSGVGALATDEKRDLLTYTVLGGVALGALGFVGGYPIAATVGLVSVAGAMLGLALLPTRVEIVKEQV